MSHLKLLITFFKNKMFSLLRAFCFLALVFTFDYTHANSESLYGASLSSCNATICTRVELPEASRSSLDDIYVFSKATLNVFQRKSVESSKNVVAIASYEGTDGYYEPTSGRVILRGVLSKKYKEIVFDLNTGNITYF